MTIQPFSSTALTDNNGNAPPEALVELAVVPAGKLLVVEHVSGRLAVRDGDVVEFLQAAAQGADSVAFCQRELKKFTNAARCWSLASIRLTGQVVKARGKKLVVSGGANATFGLFAAAIGYLVDGAISRCFVLRRQHFSRRLPATQRSCAGRLLRAQHPSTEEHRAYMSR